MTRTLKGRGPPKQRVQRQITKVKELAGRPGTKSAADMRR